MSITKSQLQLYRLLKNDIVQVSLYGCCVFIFIFIASVYNVSLQAWKDLPKEENPQKYAILADALQETIDLKLDIKRIFLGALMYFLAMGLPVFSVYYFVYKGRLQAFLNAFSRKKILSDAQIRGWAFPLFMVFSSLIVVFFTILFKYIPDETKENLSLVLVSDNWYINLVTIEFLCLLTVGAIFTKETIEKYRELERAKRLTEIRRRRTVEEALQLIKARIRPHFLFNALQNLKILAQQKSDELPVLMNQLSRLLRYTFTEADRKKVTIAKEIEFITSYLALEKLNLNKNIHFTYQNNISPDALQKEIAPMLLLVIVENCFKHYNKSSHDAQTIDIQIEATTDSLILNTQNTFDLGFKNEHSNIESNGFGLKWVEEHLRLLYSNQYILNFGQQADNRFFVKLKIPLQ